MYVVKPTVYQPSMLVSTNIVETVAAWSSGTTYALDARARTGGRVYQSLVAGNLGFPPATNATKWIDVGPDNTSAAFDGQVSTVATGTANITYVLATGIIDALALVNISASTVTVTVRDGNGGPLIYTQTVGMDGSTVMDWYQYFFFDPLVARTQVVFAGIPPYGSSHVTIEINGSGQVGVGHIAFGRANDLGEAGIGARAGITDYSKKETDTFGVTTFVRRAFSKTLSVGLLVDKLQVNRVHRLLAGLRATPCIWIGSDDPDYDEPLVVFGFYRDFNVEIAYPTKSLLSLEIEGLA